MEVPNTERLTESEIDRFDREMEGNLDNNVTQEVLLHIISDSPQACALFRAWLKEAERQTRNAQRDVDGKFGLTFNSAKGSVLHTAFCFDSIEEAITAAHVMFDRGNPDCLTELGIWWDPLYAWQEPITGATIQTPEEDVRDILPPAEDAIAASGGVPVTDDELIDTPNGRVHPDFGYVDGPEPEPE